MEKIRERLTTKQRDAEDKKWYKDKLNALEVGLESGTNGFNFSVETSTSREMRILYDLFNNIINQKDFEYVTSPYGTEVGTLPADFSNKDILSNKIKAVIGMESRRHSAMRVVAVNEEATSRKEREEAERLKTFVSNSIMMPIEEAIRKRKAEESMGRKLSPEEQQKIEQEVQAELQSMTPPEIKKYMSRVHQDPAEILHSQLLSYLQASERTSFKFKKGLKHAAISAREIYWVGEVGRKPVVKVLNPINFECVGLGDKDFIEEAEAASYRFSVTPSELTMYFGEELSDAEIDNLIEEHSLTTRDLEFSFSEQSENNVGIPVLHGEFKSLKPLKFRIFRNTEGELEEDIVDESYEMIPEAGDVLVETVWLPFVFEGYKIGKDTYAFLREVPGQFKNIDTLFDCSLSYCGAFYDNTNSKPTSLMARGKFYQYMFNIILYRIERLTAADEGKKILINKNIIPKNSGLSMSQWLHFLSVSNIGFVDPTENGSRPSGEVTQGAKEIDMSLVSDISKYINIANFLEASCAKAMGVPAQLEGDVGQYEAVANAQTAVMGGGNVLDSFFEVHAQVKANVSKKLLNVAKWVYNKYRPKHLTYTLDDMSIALIKMDYDLLFETTINLFTSDTARANQAMEAVKQLSHAALQNQSAELSDIIKIMRSESVQEAEELLAVAEQNRQEREQAISKSQQEAVMEKEKAAMEHSKIVHERELEKINLKGEWDIKKQTVLSMGFNVNKDEDNDGTPDVFEVAKFGMDAELKKEKLAIEKQNLELKKKIHEDNMKAKRQEG